MEIVVHTHPPYTVTIKSGCRTEVAQAIRECTKATKVVLVSDEQVYALYGEEILQQLKGEWETAVFLFPPGERQKNWQVLGELLEFLAEQGLDRNDCLLALGGGVVGDLTGLAAALYARGIDFIALPTTLLAQVDSSVGGKTAVDLRAGKNLAGAFHQPKAVLCDMDFLATLPPKEFACGMAEVIKYAVGFDKELYALLKEGAHKHLEAVVARSVAIKRDIVEQDEHDQGLRQTLNLGHTFGHAAEKCADFTISHGEGVAIGLSMMCHSLAKETAPMVDALLEQYHLPTHCPYSAQEMYQAVLVDKKKRGETISLIVAEEIGRCQIQTVPLTEVQHILEELQP